MSNDKREKINFKILRKNPNQPTKKMLIRLTRYLEYEIWIISQKEKWNKPQSLRSINQYQIKKKLKINL
jgi:hypothetical protein